MILCANALDFKEVQGTAGSVHQPSACVQEGLALEMKGQGSTALATHFSICTSLHLKQERYTIQGLSEPHWQMPR